MKTARVPHLLSADMLAKHRNGYVRFDVKRWRIECLDWTQEEIAKEFGIKIDIVAAWEKQLKVPRMCMFAFFGLQRALADNYRHAL